MGEPSAEWIAWLDERKHLDALFGDAALSTPDRIVARWLADHFGLSEADELFRLIAEHDTKLHPDFWWDLGRTIGSTDTTVRNADGLRRWAVLLSATAPAQRDDFVLPSIGERCAEQKLTNSVLLIFDALARSVFRLESSNLWSDDGSARQSVNDTLQLVGGVQGLETLSKAIRGMATTLGWTHLAEPLLRITARRLEERYRQRCAWRAQSRKWDRDSGAPVCYRTSRPECSATSHRRVDRHGARLSRMAGRERFPLGRAMLRRARGVERPAVEALGSPYRVATFGLDRGRTNRAGY